MEITENTKTLKFDANGLIPAIVQDHYTKEVLTLAYMNAETLALTIAEGRTVFWSRSRQEIWRKGETSGNVQRVVSITADCDKDALVIDVIKNGPACHTGAESCFFNPVYVSDELKQFTWQGLYELIEGRKTDPKEGSYTTYLFDKGLEKILKKVGEESTEVIIAGAKRDKEETVYEISDLAYHVMVLMIELGISVEDITKELEKRHVIDHKVKQERMQYYGRGVPEKFRSRSFKTVRRQKYAGGNGSNRVEGWPADAGFQRPQPHPLRLGVLHDPEPHVAVQGNDRQAERALCRQNGHPVRAGMGSFQ